METKRIYSFEEAFEASLEYFDGDQLAARVWVNKYAMKDSFGNIYEKSPEQMHWRIANEIARIEKKYADPLSAQEIFELLDHFKYIVPAGSPMTGIGNNYQVASLSNCFVIGLDGDADSYGGIMKIDEEQVQLMKRRGGVGHDLSHIRPKGSPVNNSALTSTGLVPFMERYSNSTREVAQDGRRGALMLSVSIKHPDSEAFIDAKMEEGKVTGANVSVKLDDEFMQAVVDNKSYIQQFPVNSDKPTVTKEISARMLWDKIVHNAWKSAEPGVLFWDTIVKESIPDCYADLGFTTVSTNPCGEIPLCPYDSCRLLSINLFSYVDNPFTENATFNYDKFAKHVQIAQRIMDDIVDLEMEKIELIMQKIDAQLQRGCDVVITSGLLKAIPEKIAQISELRCSDLKAIVNDFGRYGKSSRDILIPQVRYQTNDSWEVVSAGRPLTGGVSGFPILHKAKYAGAYLYVLTIPDDMGNLYDYPAPVLNEIRRTLSPDMDFYLEGPAKVSLFLYDNKTLIVENFNDEPVDVKLACAPEAFKKLTDLEGGSSVTGKLEDYWVGWHKKNATKFAITVKPHSYVAYKYE